MSKTDYLRATDRVRPGVGGGAVTITGGGGGVPTNTVTLANNAAAHLMPGGGGGVGFAFVCDATNKRGALFLLRGDGTAEYLDPESGFSATDGTANMANVYWSSPNYMIENKTGGTVTFHVYLLT